MQYGLNLSLFVDQPTISSISNDKVVNENDTATITCTVDSIPQSIIRWIFEIKELQNKYDGSITMNKINCLSMGRYTCQTVNMLGVDNRYVDVTVKCEYSFILYCRIIIYLVGFVPSWKKICVSTLTIIFKNEDEPIFLIYLLVVYICIEGTDVKCFNCYCNRGGAMIVCTLTDL